MFSLSNRKNQTFDLIPEIAFVATSRIPSHKTSVYYVIAEKDKERMKIYGRNTYLFSLTHS
ncbi:hypothetical protein CPter291_4965 [Collimonas pratensis]|uniref:Uncharacterized protein n=1 Tax=Collimonas pratensis TaxID=279113 RepID=A0ABN4MIR2_9BURK|nr:hypothetical protein CPter291_4965 [Collimonas pratensis]